MKAKEYLEQYAKLDAVIINKTIEAEQWEALATSITAQMDGERVQSSGNQQKMADAINRSVDIKAEVEALIRKKQEITETIEQLPIEEYKLLHKVYIQQKGMKAAQVEDNRSYSWVTTVHGKALSKLQDILDKREKG